MPKSANFPGKLNTAMIRSLWRLARPTLNRLGIDIVPVGRLEFAQHIRRLGITLAFDVGANVGQFGTQLRDSGFRGRIISFEPIEQVYEALRECSSNDPNWIPIRAAIGARKGVQDIMVSKNTVMSSFREMAADFQSDHPWASYVRSEAVDVITFDDVFSSYATQQDRVLLKMDVQGYENEVLSGAEQSLSKVVAVQTEMSLHPTYVNERLMPEQITFFQQHGFRLVDIANVFRDPHGRLSHVDGFFEALSELSMSAAN